MKILAFKISNFRSIVDSRWISLSLDGITVFVGQNESGKTSVLEALHRALSSIRPTEDDIRSSGELPKVSLKIQCGYSDLAESLDEFTPGSRVAVKRWLTQQNDLVELGISWTRNSQDSKTPFSPKIWIESPSISTCLDNVTTSPKVSAQPPDTSSESDSDSEIEVLSADEFAHLVWKELPLAVLFNEDSGRLTNTVDIDDNGLPTGIGANAAANYLLVAGIDLPELLKRDKRARENQLNKANAQLSEDFNSFWSQKIGKSGNLSLKCEIDHYSHETPDKAGKPYLIFWICDGNTQLYPKQRSQGVRWFVSFYLQLKASEKRKEHRIFLLDEPGANLHSKAQADVLKLINDLGKDTSTVIYSTHSPQLLEYPKLFRVRAVQRDGDQEDSPSIIIDAHHLGTASSDTLSPILSAMGVDLSAQEVIRKENNVLLEEMSGFYYLTSFWKILKIQTPAYFIAATGVNKIEALANMFRGWGLDFIVAVDDDKQGREAYKAIKRELFGDDEQLARKKLIKLPGGTGIEDIFSANDFKKYVLNDDQAAISSTNADYMKSNGISKPVTAFKFALAVENGNVTWDNFDEVTKKNIETAANEISQRLAL